MVSTVLKKSMTDGWEILQAPNKVSGTIIEGIPSVPREVAVETFPRAVREAWTETFPVYERHDNIIELGPQAIEKDFRDNIVGMGSMNGSIPDLSNKAVKHPMNDHMPIRYAKQLQYMSRDAAEKYLSYKTFFNSKWTDEQVRAALNFGYKSALNNGTTTGKYLFKYLGENVTVCLEDGVFKTGYGDYVYTYDELIKLLEGK